MSLARIVARPEALDAATYPDDALVLRVAADEVFVLPESEVTLADPHALFLSETGFAGVWLEAERARGWLERHCRWPLPAERPAFAQGAVAELPVKLYFEGARVLVLTPAPYGADLAERLA